MTWEQGQNPNNLLALLGRKILEESKDYDEVAKKLDRLKREGYCTYWEMKIHPTKERGQVILKVSLERKRNNG